MIDIAEWVSQNDNQVWYGLFTSIYVAFCCMYYASALVVQQFSWKKNVLIYLGISLFTWAWNLFAISNASLFMFGFYFSFSLVLKFIYQLSGRNAIFYALIYYFALSYVSRILGWVYQTLGGSYYIVDIYYHWNEPWIYFLLALVSVIILYYVNKQVRRIADFDLSQIKLSEFIYILILVIPLAYFCYSLTLLSVVYIDLPFGIILLRSILCIGIMEAMIGLVTIRKQQLELEELRTMEHRLQEQYQRLVIKREYSELIMQKSHDLQKHLRLFQETNDSGHLFHYQKELKQTLETYDSVIETGNATLDTILSEKDRLCRTHQITLVCIGDGSLVQFMDPIDICTIFENALDNAIESAGSLSDPEKKIIHLKIVQENYLLILRFENYYEHTLNWQDDHLMTGKDASSGHGYGLKSIRYAVGKYKGDLRITTENGNFTLTILINR